MIYVEGYESGAVDDGECMVSSQNPANALKMMAATCFLPPLLRGGDTVVKEGRF